MNFKKIPLIRFRRPKVGALPGSIVVSPETPKPTINIIRYNSEQSEVYSDVQVNQITNYLKNDCIVWIDIQGLGDAQNLKEIAELFEISGLALGDIVNVPQRPKAEYFDEDLLIVTKMIHLQKDYQLEREQISLYLRGSTVITFQEHPGDVFDPIRRRLKIKSGLLRTSNAAFLTYSLLDMIVDSYFPILEVMGDYLQKLEHYALTRPNRPVLQRISDVKNQLLNLRRAILPFREILKVLLGEGNNTFDENCRRHLRDTQEHVVHATDINEMYREMASDLMHLAMSVISNRTNDQMKVLTIMASIFIPLTFIAGVYGMNFEHMPELHYRWAYPAVWVAMLFSAFGSLLYFIRKGWIIDRRAGEDPFQDIHVE